MSLPGLAQEHSEHSKTEHNRETEELKPHRVAFFTGNTIVPDGSSKVSGALIVPTIGLEYQYFFTHRFAIGIHTDLELMPYVIENEERDLLQREYAVIVALVGVYELGKNWVIFGGPGREFESHESFYQS